MRRRRAFTLAEVMLALGLVALLYTIMTYVMVQVSQASRRGALAARHKIELLKVSEQLRWQLRGLYVPPPDPDAAPSPSNTPGPSPAAGASPSPSPSPAQAAPGYLTPGAVLIGQTTQEDKSDLLIFLTDQPSKGRGVVEVGYQIMTTTPSAFNSSTGKTPTPAGNHLKPNAGPSPLEPSASPLSANTGYLAYREFHYRDSNGLHDKTDHEDAPWQVLSRDINALWLEYSADGATWQRSWDQTDPPHWIRINLETVQGDKFYFKVTPGVASLRW